MLVYKREREWEGGKERETDREKDRQRQSEADTKTDTETEGSVASHHQSASLKQRGKGRRGEESGVVSGRRQEEEKEAGSIS